MKILRHLTISLVAFSALIAAGAFVFAVAVTFVVSVFKNVEISAWNIVTSQIARWFLFWTGIYAIHNVLPIAVAHGRTRREFLAAATVYTVVLAAVMSLITWLGFFVEGGIYALMDWRADEHGTLPAYFLMFLVWCGVGAFVAAAFDRFGAGGILALPFGLALVVSAGMLVPGSGNLPFLRNIPDVPGGGWQLASVAGWLVALVATWVIARDMPIKTRTS